MLCVPIDQPAELNFFDSYLTVPILLRQKKFNDLFVVLQICADVLHRAVHTVQLCPDYHDCGLHQGEMGFYSNTFIGENSLMTSPFALLDFAECPGDVHRDGVQ